MESQNSNESPAPVPALANQTVIPTPQHSDSIFISTDQGRLLQWSTRNRKVTKNFGQILNYRIDTSKTTPDKKYLFISDYKGNMKQICLRSQKVSHDYGKITDDGIYFIATTSDNNYTFVACGSLLKQYSVSSHKLIHSYPFDTSISSIITTLDSKHAFVGLTDGSLLQIYIFTQKVIKEYGIEDSGGDFILAMAVTKDSKFLVIGYYTGTMKKISI
jgi:hypothetical protein